MALDEANTVVLSGLVSRSGLLEGAPGVGSVYCDSTACMAVVGGLVQFEEGTIRGAFEFNLISPVQPRVDTLEFLRNLVEKQSVFIAGFHEHLVALSNYLLGYLERELCKHDRRGHPFDLVVRKERL